ncbi:hypothetical protein HZ326_20578 [Fusarium oxysporum f. sp. albedinis]|nr:hypothetical protein HZ326_20578 [Fusarium oxysporum f. sp. albedinis]
MTWAANETYTRWLLPLASTGGNGLPNLHRSGPCFSFLVLLLRSPSEKSQRSLVIVAICCGVVLDRYC